VFEQAADPSVVHADGGGCEGELFHKFSVVEEAVDEGFEFEVLDVADDLFDADEHLRDVFVGVFEEFGEVELGEVSDGGEGIADELEVALVSFDAATGDDVAGGGKAVVHVAGGVPDAAMDGAGGVAALGLDVELVVGGAGDLLAREDEGLVDGVAIAHLCTAIRAMEAP